MDKYAFPVYMSDRQKGMTYKQFLMGEIGEGLSSNKSAYFFSYKKCAKIGNKLSDILIADLTSVYGKMETYAFPIIFKSKGMLQAQYLASRFAKGMVLRAEFKGSTDNLSDNGFYEKLSEITLAHVSAQMKEIEQGEELENAKSRV